MTFLPSANAGGALEWLMADGLDLLNRQKFAKISAGESVVDLSMINPDIEPPRILIDKLMESSLRLDRHRYAVSRGVRKLREAFALKYQRAFGAALDPEHEICVTLGAKDALVHGLMCLAGAGTRALVGCPSYPAHLSALKLANIPYDFFQICGDEESMLREIAARCAESTYRILLLNFPNNPTGVKVGSAFYRELLRLAEKYDLFVVNDFVYGEMSYENGPAPSLLAAPGAVGRCAEVYSLSKAYSIPGWRVGAVLGSRQLVKTLGRLKAQIDYGVFLPIQEAAAAALAAGPELTQPILERYRRRCMAVAGGLRKLGWNLAVPQAGASVWAEVPRELGGDGDALALEFLERAGVMLLPGSLFGGSCRSFVRFALVVSEEKLHGVVAALRELTCAKNVRRQDACANS